MAEESVSVSSLMRLMTEVWSARIERGLDEAVSDALHKAETALYEAVELLRDKETAKMVNVWRPPINPCHVCDGTCFAPFGCGSMVYCGGDAVLMFKFQGDMKRRELLRWPESRWLDSDARKHDVLLRGG